MLGIMHDISIVFDLLNLRSVWLFVTLEESSFNQMKWTRHQKSVYKAWLKATKILGIFHQIWLPDIVCPFVFKRPFPPLIFHVIWLSANARLRKHSSHIWRKKNLEKEIFTSFVNSFGTWFGNLIFKMLKNGMMSWRFKKGSKMSTWTKIESTKH